MARDTALEPLGVEVTWRSWKEDVGAWLDDTVTFSCQGNHFIVWSISVHCDWIRLMGAHLVTKVTKWPRCLFRFDLSEGLNDIWWHNDWYICAILGVLIYSLPKVLCENDSSSWVGALPFHNYTPTWWSVIVLSPIGHACFCTVTSA